MRRWIVVASAVAVLLAMVGQASAAGVKNRVTLDYYRATVSVETTRKNPSSNAIVCASRSL